MAEACQPRAAAGPPSNEQEAAGGTRDQAVVGLGLVLVNKTNKASKQFILSSSLLASRSCSIWELPSSTTPIWSLGLVHPT